MTGAALKTSAKSLLQYALIIVVMGAVFSFLGIYDSDTMSPRASFGFWTATMAAGGLAMLLVEPWVFGRLLRDRHPALQLSVIATLISLPLTIAIAGFNTSFRFDLHPVNWLLQFFSVLMIAIIIVVGNYAFKHVRSGTTARDPGPSPIGGFLERLPLRYRDAELYAVSSEGHYLRIHTNRGEEMILMRLSDAVRELAEADGLQVHRSWWVAKAGIADVKSRNGQRTLILKSGNKAPVSRTFVKALKEAGLDA